VAGGTPASSSFVGLAYHLSIESDLEIVKFLLFIFVCVLSACVILLWRYVLFLQYVLPVLYATKWAAAAKYRPGLVSVGISDRNGKKKDNV
jgi:hypothetical protein